jgi:predicted YcjX-like family ATPase
MNKQISLTLAALAVTVSSMPIANAFAKQQCNESIASNQRGYWSWRIIDGRKCWYEGKPMLSKSSLEWPAQATNHPPSSDEELASAMTKRSDPLDAQAEATDVNTFEAL